MQKSKILIVEDEPLVALDIKNNLKNLGYEVIDTAVHGKEAIKMAEANQPDLVLMDIMLQGKTNGIDTAHQIRNLFHIPVVFITAYSDAAIIRKAKLTEPYGYIIKPVDEKNLLITIELALHKRKIEKEIEKRAHQALIESEERYRKLVENINEGIVMQDRHGIITYANEKFFEMIGYAQEEVIGHSIANFLGEGFLKKDEGVRSDQSNIKWKALEFAWKKKSGQIIYTILSPKPIFNEKGKFRGVVSVLTDITERRQIELELKRSREELRNLSHYIQSVREKESRRIAREIHDELGQKLTALKMDLSWLSQKINQNDVDQKKFQAKSNSMSDLIDTTIHTVQKISAELRPGLLDDLGLFPAIEWLAQDFENRTKIQCRTQIDCGELDLDTDVSTAIFRISQEALTNAARHSKATRVDISLKEKNGILELKIRDNGKGIQAKKINAPSSLGLMGMRERLHPFMGELRIKGVPDKGTTLHVVLPIKEVGT